MTASTWFGAPEWLVLAPFVAFAAWRWRALNTWRALRLAALLLLVLILAEPRWPHGGGGTDLWMLVDRSASVRERIEPRHAEIESLLARGRGSDDRLFVVDFAAAPLRRGETNETFTGGIDQTRIASAIRFALSQMEPARAARLLLLTDGYSTEPLTGLASSLVRERVPLDVRLFVQEPHADAGVRHVRVPASVQPQEPFLVEAEVHSGTDGSLPLKIFRNGSPVGETTVHIEGGVGRVRFTDRLGGTGGARYEVRVVKELDAIPGNDAASAWTKVTGGRRVLLVTAYRDDPLAAVLRAQDFDVDAVTDPSGLSVGRLAGARLLIVNNVPAHRIPSDFLAAAATFVNVQGGGLLMAGGRWSFGSGGYFQSALDGLLPVSMELRQEHRKLAVALALVLDRSGSMTAPVGNGRTKMDLANDGAARSLELLTDHDAAAVIAVDSEAHTVLPLATLGRERNAAIDIVRRLESGGGGIFVGAALRAAWDALDGAPQGQRHVILFADAADAEEPADYQATLRAMVDAGATVSVIGLGTENDSDAALLKAVAEHGKGRIFFTDEPSTLPALFAQETVTVARSAFLTDPVKAQATAGWREIAQDGLGETLEVDAYNLSYLRDGATAAFVSQDEYKAPLFAFWHRGAGRSAAISFPLGGEHSDRVRAWKEYGGFTQTVARWLAAADLPPGVSLRTRVTGHELSLVLLLDREWEARVAGEPPRLQVVEGAHAPPRTIAWERMGPGRFEARLALAPGRVYNGAVGVGNLAVPFGPVEGPQGAEWSFDRARVRELLSVAQQSGGREITNLASAWQRPSERRSPLDLRPALLIVFLAVFLGDALRTRVRGPRVRAAGVAMPPAAVIDRPPAKPQTPPPVADDALADRLRRAKRR